jgi:predicted component of type VI protein secretion system
MRAAFVEFLDRLDPAELEARVERAARRGKARSADKARYWELFTTFYRNLIEMPPSICLTPSWKRSPRRTVRL